ncbi:MAG: efflux RND transporter permease subunit, partial [bacterium]
MAQSLSTMTGTELDQLCINTVRTLSMDAVQQANSGHPGTPMALAPLAWVLWSRHLRYNPADPNWFNRDRFVLSAGHGSMLLYSLLFLAGLGLTYLIFQRVPTGFVPDEDQGYFIIVVQSPPGASLQYTSKIGEQVTKILQQQPEVESVFAIAGFSFSGAAANRGLVFATLQPYSKRRGDEHTAATVIQRITGPLFGITGAVVLAFPPPAVQG